MSEVSLETESSRTSAADPQVDGEDVDRAECSLSEGNADSVGDSSEDRADELYDINIDSGAETEEGTECKNLDQEDSIENKRGVVKSGKGDGAHTSDSADKDGRETPEESGDLQTSETKGSTMAEDAHRSSAAEIPVTFNGELDQSPEPVFPRDSYSGSPGALNLTDPGVSPSSFASPAEGTIEPGAYKGQMQGQPQSGALVLSDDLRSPALEKLDLVRKWSINTYKCTRQIISEKLGKGSKTVDMELEAQIDVLRDNKRKYQHVIRLAQTLSAQLSQIMQTQKQLGDAFADLSLKSPELHEEFGYNAETQKLLSKNGETLLAAINFFISSVNTLVDKTIEDTMINIKQYEIARVEYDAYRTDLEELNLGPRDANTMPKIEQSQEQFQIHREKYERMRNDVSVKLKFLEENKVKVMHNQLILFHNAIAAYYAGNQQQLEATLKQFHIKLKMPGGDNPSWLEESH
uniref:ADP-ribosylation factor interacting protein 1 (arfaptin 1) n=1 Tax=Neogobius melanostomus TaxID=47308 RepID=A0A8C6UEX5_9GOBI